MASLLISVTFQSVKRSMLSYAGLRCRVQVDITGGTDFDVFDKASLPEGVKLQLEPWEYLSGHQAQFYQWLKSNLRKFGFSSLCRG